MAGRPRWLAKVMAVWLVCSSNLFLGLENKYLIGMKGQLPNKLFEDIPVPSVVLLYLLGPACSPGCWCPPAAPCWLLVFSLQLCASHGQLQGVWEALSPQGLSLDNSLGK